MASAAASGQVVSSWATAAKTARGRHPHVSASLRPTANPAVESLLAQPLPTRHGRFFASARSLPWLATRVLASATWTCLLLVVLRRLLQLTWHEEGTAATPAAVSDTAGEVVHEEDVMKGWLACIFLVASVSGHHLLCQYDMNGIPRRCGRQGAQLQSLLLQTAAWQARR